MVGTASLKPTVLTFGPSRTEALHGAVRLLRWATPMSSSLAFCEKRVVVMYRLRPSFVIRRQRLLRAARWNAAPSIHASHPIGYVAADLAAFDGASRALAVREGCFLHAHRGLCAAAHILRIEISTAAQRHCRRDEQHLHPSLHMPSSCVRSPIR